MQKSLSSLKSGHIHYYQKRVASCRKAQTESGLRPRRAMARQNQPYEKRENYILTHYNIEMNILTLN